MKATQHTARNVEFWHRGKHQTIKGLLTKGQRGMVVKVKRNATQHDYYEVNKDESGKFLGGQYYH